MPTLDDVRQLASDTVMINQLRRFLNTINPDCAQDQKLLADIVSAVAPLERNIQAAALHAHRRQRA